MQSRVSIQTRMDSFFFSSPSRIFRLKFGWYYFFTMVGGSKEGSDREGIDGVC